ncbi:MAG TPA: class I SAM-dependent methyltransferase [Phycisphaerae bacterium]|nr:class I SAM-dependent methyltransferase [Phycisphaerae bacterium]
MNTQDIRERYRRVIEANAPHEHARKWRVGRFERGLRLAREIESRIGSLRGRRVLDVGAAHGGDICAMYAHGAHCVGADMFDHDYDQLARAMNEGVNDVHGESNNPQDGSLRFARFNALSHWPVQSQSFDVVISLGVLEIVEDLDLFFAEMARVLAPGGLAVVYTGTAFRMVRRDALYKLPFISLLPVRLRRLVAERVFNRSYRFPVSNHTFYSASKISRHAGKHGLRVSPQKYASSVLMRRISAWPLGPKVQNLVKHLAFDFVVVTPK